MLPRVQRWLCLVAAPLALTVDAAGAQTAGSSMQAMPQKRQGMPDQVLSQGAHMSASPERAANTEESGINVILKSDEPRVPMRDPKRGITMPGNTMADNDVYHQFLFDRFEAIRAPAATGLARLWWRAGAHMGSVRNPRPCALLVRCRGDTVRQQRGARGCACTLYLRRPLLTAHRPDSRNRSERLRKD